MSPRHKTAEGLTLVGASAGSGKTFRLTEEVAAAIAPGEKAIDLEGLVAVTYTKRAAADLGARIRRTLVEKGAHARAQRLPLAYLGTVHAVCLRLLQEFAIDAGLSPHVDVVPGSEARLLRQALEWGLDPAFRQRVQGLADSLQIRWNPITERTDWITPVEDVMTLARSNRIDPSALHAMGERSAAGLVAMLGRPSADGDAMDAALLKALESASRALSKIDDGQKNTREWREYVDGSLHAAKKDALHWSDWVKLAKATPGKSAKAAVEPLIAIASRVGEHPRLHAEVREFTQSVFAAASAGLAAYDTWKQRRRVVDFVDMIDRALTLVEQKDVADELRDRIRLLVIDEFQDTSPVQLALFVRLHALAAKSTWVGDRKQCIFEFAGADPTLMEALARWVDKEGGNIEQLLLNRRSRPELVDACSHLFAAAFARHGYETGEVDVKPWRVTPEALASLPPFGYWALGVKNQDDEAEAIAEGIRRLIETPSVTPVVDRATGEVRDLRPGDVALLVATNAQAERVAKALFARGVRATLAQAGLLSTPEGTLVDAALRAVVDSRDELAHATLEALTGFEGSDPDAWLDARMAQAAARRAAKEKTKEKEVAPPVSMLVARVNRLAGELEGASPSEALDRVLGVLDVATIACRWPDPDQRLANLDALRAMAAAYEERCARERAAATIAGLLRYFDEAAQVVLVRDEERASDEQHVGTGDGAVTVLTYHRAKGLEWPVVILGSLDKSERRNAFEVSPETDHPDFDPADPLAGRWIRYWPWPFGLQKKTPLTDLAAASVEGKAVALREERERVRLLYVGFTRARDHLILAARVEAKGPAVEWLDELCDADDEPLVKFPSEPGEAERPVVSLRGIGGRIIEVPTRHWTLGTGGDTPARLANPDSHVWFARPDVGSGERATRPSYWIAPSRAATEWPDLVVPGVGSSAGAAPIPPVELLAIGQRLPLGEEKDVTWDLVGDAMHAFLAADVAGLEREQRLARAHRILVASNLGSLLTAHALLRAGDQLRGWVDARWPGATWHREFPVTAALASPGGARRVQGTIDLLLEAPEGVVLIDHKSFPGGQSQWGAKANEFAPQLAAYRHVLAAGGKRVVATYVHFPIGAGVAKL
jgi:ATP-dependent helicase/nuclease subunit A